MKIVIDSDARLLTVNDGGSERSLSLYSQDAFEILSQQWLQMGSALGYKKNFSWAGQPITELPEDLIRLQEVVYRVKPSVILEVGVSNQGLLFFHATLCEAIGSGRVIGIGDKINETLRETLKSHPVGSRITLLEGQSTSREVLDSIRAEIGESDAVLVILRGLEDLEQQLEAYSKFVTPGSNLIAVGALGSAAHHTILLFTTSHPEFLAGQPDSSIRGVRYNPAAQINSWEGGWLQKVG